MEYSRCALLIREYFNDSHKTLGKPGRQALLTVWYSAIAKRERITFFSVFLCQELFCANHYLRAHVNRSVEKANGANIYYLL